MRYETVINVKTGERVRRELPPLPVSADDVRAEAMRRILAIAPEWRQRNLTAQAAILAAKGRDNWTAADQAAWDAGEIKWAEIAALRAASNVLEAMQEIPQDYRDDKHWGGA